jgi:cellulose synthase/poly-beta-1,6-N-acetylglucosamine synthase-like glycosyltransferase
MSAGSPAVSVVVPLFNEEENVPILQGELTAALSGLDYEIIFVDDGSRSHGGENRKRSADSLCVSKKRRPKRGHVCGIECGARRHRCIDRW